MLKIVFPFSIVWPLVSFDPTYTFSSRSKSDSLPIRRFFTTCLLFLSPPCVAATFSFSGGGSCVSPSGINLASQFGTLFGFILFGFVGRIFPVLAFGLNDSSVSLRTVSQRIRISSMSGSRRFGARIDRWMFILPAVCRTTSKLSFSLSSLSAGKALSKTVPL